MILQKDKNNNIFESAQLQPNCAELTEVETRAYLLQKAKDAKKAILLNNCNAEIKRDHLLSSVTIVDNLNRPISVGNAYFKIKDPNILTHETAIVFAGAFKTQEIFNQILIDELKAMLPNFASYETIKNKVYNANKVFIPYTTTNSAGEEIKVLLSAKDINGIFGHLFGRVASASSVLGIKRQAIEDATTIEELEAIDLTFSK